MSLLMFSVLTHRINLSPIFRPKALYCDENKLLSCSNHRNISMSNCTEFQQFERMFLNLNNMNLMSTYKQHKNLFLRGSQGGASCNPGRQGVNLSSCLSKESMPSRHWSEEPHFQKVWSQAVGNPSRCTKKQPFLQRRQMFLQEKTRLLPLFYRIYFL